ncbi:MAG: ankyrin repeat domain-containing protein [Steroidobacteraceae bacterium]
MSQQRLWTSVLVMSLVTASGVALAAPGGSVPDLRISEAVKRGDQAAVKGLLRERAAVNAAEGDGSTALHWAAYADDLGMVKMLLAADADVNAATRLQAVTPLYMASQTGDAALIDLLVKHGANPNQANWQGTTPLMIAAASGSAQAVDVLVAHGADVNARESLREQTALMFAANLNRADAIRALIAHGADPDLASKVVPATRYERPRRPAAAKAAGANGTAVPAADPAEEDEDDAPKPATPAPLNSANNSGQGYSRQTKAVKMGGFSPLHYAAREGNAEAIKALLEGGADKNLPSGSEQTTPLLLAIHNGHFDAARVLLEHGADVNKANVMGFTPLYATIDVQWAPHQWSPEPIVVQEDTNYLALMKMLIEHGADLNARIGAMPWFRTLTQNRLWTDMGGSTAFWRAALANDLQAMQLLKDAGADMTIPTVKGTTPLMAAAGMGWAANWSTTAPTRVEAVKFMLATGADVNHIDELGFSVMHGAALTGDLVLIQYLADAGAKTDVKTKAGDYPADYANGPFQKSLPIPEAVALLEKLGSPNSHNCRSSECVPPVVAEPVAAVAKAGAPAKKE